MNVNFEQWVLQNTVYPDVTYHNFLREQSANHDRILEVGVHIGSSFIGMLRDRKFVHACGIDAFMQNSIEDTNRNLELFEVYRTRINLIAGRDHIHMADELYKWGDTFVHLDADHSMEGTLCELYACHAAPSVRTIVVHDLIDERVYRAVDQFHTWNSKDWDVQYISHEAVFNGCILLERI